MPEARVLVFGGSIRTGSLSAKLAAVAAKELALLDADVSLASLADYPMPIYNGDIEANEGIPENVQKFARLVAAHNGLFITTPEYNHSLPPLLKNTIDWLSRAKTERAIGTSLKGKVYGIGSTSNGMLGGARALIDLRKVLATALSAFVVPEQVSVSVAGRAFDDHGNLIEDAPARLVQTVSKRLVETARRLHEAT